MTLLKSIVCHFHFIAAVKHAYYLLLLFVIYIVPSVVDAVGWAAGRASSL